MPALMTLKHAMYALMIAVLAGLIPLRAAYAEPPPCCVFMSQSTLTKVRQQLLDGSAAKNTTTAYRQLLESADKALTGPAFSVTDKGLTPPGGDKHDYMSIAVYTWPDPSKPDGMPWVHRDGKINPATKNNQTDAARFANFTRTVETLTLAGFLSGRQDYSARAAALLRIWFFAPETRMNPNLNYAQSVPGRYDGRPEGVLDGRLLATRIVDSVLLLRMTPVWQRDDDTRMEQWMRSYYHWLTTNENAKKEGAKKNNHATWYNVQAAGIARYLGYDDQVQLMLQRTKRLIDGQIAADGSQPLELSRTRSYHYSNFNLQPLVMLATLGASLGTDLWHYTNPQGASILSAVSFMAPYADPARPWPYKTLDRDSLELIPLLIMTDNSLKTRTFRPLIDAADFGRLPHQDIDANMGTLKTALQESWLIRLPD